MAFRTASLLFAYSAYCMYQSTLNSTLIYLLIVGVNLEHGPNKESNNTLITSDDIGERERTLFCSTDREDCCTDELNIGGYWFLPNGSKVLSRIDTQPFYIILGNQSVGLNIMNSSELPTGIYHCEMKDKNNVTHYLYAGIYPENEGITLCNS